MPQAPITPARHDYLPARDSHDADLPWIPFGEGNAWKPLRFFSHGGFVQLFRMAPGSESPPHRHSGETHAFQLAGQRRLRSGEVIGPGDYVCEPIGEVDSWSVIGDEPLLLLAVVHGAVEFVDPDGNISSRLTAQTQFERYAEHCREHSLALHDLFD
jgi:hypothetical protein